MQVVNTPCLRRMKITAIQKVSASVQEDPGVMSRAPGPGVVEHESSEPWWTSIRSSTRKHIGSHYCNLFIHSFQLV